MGSIVPATVKTHGPFRKVAEVVEEIVTLDYKPPRTQRIVYEMLECGHRGENLLNVPHPWTNHGLSWLKEPNPRPAGRKRRCYSCRVPSCDWCGKEGTEDDPLSDRLPIWGANDGAHAACLEAYREDRAREEAWTAEIREKNLARRRAAGEDV